MVWFDRRLKECQRPCGSFSAYVGRISLLGNGAKLRASVGIHSSGGLKCIAETVSDEDAERGTARGRDELRRCAVISAGVDEMDRLGGDEPGTYSTALVVATASSNNRSCKIAPAKT